MYFAHETAILKDKQCVIVLCWSGSCLDGTFVLVDYGEVVGGEAGGVVMDDNRNPSICTSHDINPVTEDQFNLSCLNVTVVMSCSFHHTLVVFTFFVRTVS